MTQVNSENSIAMPVVSTRRRFLSQAAAVTAGGAALGLALPLPGSAEAAQQVHDPIFAMIERHRDLSSHCSAAYEISGKLLKGPKFDAADAVSAERHGLVEDQADALICTEPSTMAGVLAMMRYAATWSEWQQPTEGWTLDDASADSHQVLLETLARAIESIIDQSGGVT
jgi:hypothetical protein